MDTDTEYELHTRMYGLYLQMCTPCAAVHMDGWMDGWINVMNMNISDGGKFIDIP